MSTHLYKRLAMKEHTREAVEVGGGRVTLVHPRSVQPAVPSDFDSKSEALASWKHATGHQVRGSMDARSEKTKSTSQRAERFPVHVPLRYRSVGKTKWIEGMMENISRTGILFRGPHVLPAEARLEINLILPLQQACPLAVTVLYQGRIVRTQRPARANQLAVLAVRFLKQRGPSPA